MGKRILCAVSGGADSMCLLHFLRSAGLNVVAAHFEHGIRGEESLADAKFVADWCAKNGIECIVGHGAVISYAESEGLGIEEAARKLRYDFLLSTAKERGFDYVATAHNAGDNAETMLFNLCRGTGSAGLRGIPAERGIIIRPLLGVKREEIESYLEENHIPHVEDSSNRSDAYSRNLIRHKVVPVLRSINPELEAAMGRTAKLLRMDEDCLSLQAKAFAETFFDGESLPTAELLALHPAVSSRVIRAMCNESLSYEHVESVLRLCRGTELAYADVPGARFRVERGRLWLGDFKRLEIKSRPLVPGKPLRIPEAGLEIYSEIVKYGIEVNDLFKTYYFKCEKICNAVSVGGASMGEKLRPQGRGCSKSLKQLFAEAGYPATRRSATPVFRDDEGILAVYGLAVDERVRPQPGDEVLKIEVIRQENC